MDSSHPEAGAPRRRLGGMAPWSRMAAAAALLGLSVPVAAEAPAADEATVELYRAKCQICHMADGNSPVPAMNFANGAWQHGSRLADVIKVITEGVPGKAMTSFKKQLTKEQIEALARYVRSFDKKLKDEKTGKGGQP
jgi:mono/diheme cytochrome c family protein